MNPTGDHWDTATDMSLGAITTLPEFLTTAGRLTIGERRLIVDQALLLIEQFYVHLPLKRAMHGVDPVQRLKLLRHRLDTIPEERRFHDEMISIFTSLRDLHTRYVLPAPFESTTANLPLRIEEFFEDDGRRYLVTELTPGVIDDPHFERGVVITHWNGVPIDRAVELNADRQPGSNPAARHARGIDTMTARDMGLSAPPDEDWVVLNYVATDGRKGEVRVEWLVSAPDLSPTAVDANSAEDPFSQALGIDIQTERIRRARKLLFAPEAMELERQVTATFEARGGLKPGEAVPDPGMANVSTFPDKLEFRTVNTAHGEFGYIRIRSFHVGYWDVDSFVAEVARIARLLPQNGLIVDVRGNGGGTIMAGERLLQLFTPERIEPERLHFINTPLTVDLSMSQPSLEVWRKSVTQAVETGAAFSDGFPFSTEEPENCNSLGQQYYGPAVLIIDGLCYSTTDIFAAGWQDHGIGPILGTHECTGAGGANVWTHELLGQYLPGPDSPIRPLPKGSAMRVAIRRSTRVGPRSGEPLEDLGVKPDPDKIHRMTRNDLLNHNEDLIARAADILASVQPVRALSVEVDRASDLEVSVSTTTENIPRLDAYVDGRPRLTLDLEDGQTTFDLQLDSPGPHTLELRGFEGKELVAARRIRV